MPHRTFRFNYYKEQIMTIRRWLVCVALVLVGIVTLGAEKVAEEDNRPAELKVLDRWVGEWDMTAEIKPTDFLPQGSKSTFKMTIKWAVNGRFIRCDAEGEGAQGNVKFKDAFMWIATFDPMMRAYTSSVFWANVGGPGGPNMWGGGQQGGGKWDEQAKTLTIMSTDKDAGIGTTSVTKWIDADTHEFVSTMTDGNGKVFMEMIGKAKRRK
jgi:hypothetical protein